MASRGQRVFQLDAMYFTGLTRRMLIINFWLWVSNPRLFGLAAGTHRGIPRDGPAAESP